MIASCPKGDLREAAWIDLSSPSETELRQVRALTGLEVPTQEQVSEIESTSRLAFEDGSYWLSTPLVSSAHGGHLMVVPVGFVLSEKHLLTVRFAEVKAIDAALSTCKETSAQGAFVHVLEVVIDRLADALERASADSEVLAHETFRTPPQPGRRARDLRETLRQVGAVAEHNSHVRDALLGVGRIAAYANTVDGAPRIDAGRLSAIRADVASLTDYESHLAGKIQFLLDATLGFISVEQNDVVKTLTIASVVGIPPVLIAGIYGMNFKYMPELSWRYGYPAAIALMIVSGLIPFLWFKRRGWT
ncbi:MAG TPA: magnesium transporter CorA family protein [Myxococcales bacterium]|jgi:magnesium transporter